MPQMHLYVMFAQFSQAVKLLSTQIAFELAFRFGLAHDLTSISGSCNLYTFIIFVSPITLHWCFIH